MSAAREEATPPERRRATSAVAATFPDPESAERGVRALQSAGFGREVLGLAMRRREEPGGRVGGVLGSLLGAQELRLPDIGPVVAAGTLLAALRAGTGVAEALATWGVPEVDARRCAERFAAGDAVLTATSGLRRHEALVLLRENAAELGSLAEQIVENTLSWDGVERRKASRRQSDRAGNKRRSGES
ncbi:MAG TPA: hypothetical protein VFS33_07185 [Gemmatimonadales bacterium]|nr:hypothetical protein [Gemmatimonadales bacterium]